MSCSKCEPQAKRRRWVWWGGLLVLVSAAALLDRARPTAHREPAEPGAPVAPAR